MGWHSHQEVACICVFSCICRFWGVYSQRVDVRPRSKDHLQVLAGIGVGEMRRETRGPATKIQAETSHRANKISVAKQPSIISRKKPEAKKRMGRLKRGSGDGLSGPRPARHTLGTPKAGFDRFRFWLEPPRILWGCPFFLNS